MIPFLRRRQGFTLIELLVVVLILGILVAVALPSYISSSLKAKQSTADHNARAIASAIQSVAVKTKTYPTGALSNATVISDIGGAIPNNPCSASTGAAGYTYTYTSATKVSIQANTDACTGFTARVYTIQM